MATYSLTLNLMQIKNTLLPICATDPDIYVTALSASVLPLQIIKPLNTLGVNASLILKKLI